MFVWERTNGGQAPRWPLFLKIQILFYKASKSLKNVDVFNDKKTLNLLKG
jgi:hypothetical protein